MKKNRLGRTELKVSQIVLGGGWVGGLFIDPDLSIMEKALVKAINSGINWIDTAESYSDGQSEKNIGLLLSSIKNNNIYISSKARLEPNSSETIFSQLDRKIDESLERLNRSYIDLYQLHNRIEKVGTSRDFSALEITQRKGVLDSMEKLKSEGRIKNIGITALGNTEPIKKVISTKGFDTAQVYYNLLNPSSAFKKKLEWDDHDFSGIINECLKNDMGIMCIRIFAAGYLATDIRHGREISVTQGISELEQKRRIKKLFEILKNEKGTRAQIALRYGFSNESLSCIVTGLSKIEHLDQIIEAESFGPLDQNLIEKINFLHKSNFS